MSAERSRGVVPYYEDGSVTIYHADAELMLSALPCWDRLITDPPYGFGAYKTDIAPGLEFVGDIVKKSKTAALFGYPELLVSWCVALQLIPDEWATWWPTNRWGGRAQTFLPRESECIAIFGEVCGSKRLKRPRSNVHPMFAALAARKGGDVENALLGDVWRDPAPGRGGFRRTQRKPFHMNEKPLGVMCNLVELCTQPEDVCLDPFCGSGSTLVAAKSLGRKAIGVEIEERYCQIAAERCSQEVLAQTQCSHCVDPTNCVADHCARASVERVSQLTFEHELTA